MKTLYIARHAKSSWDLSGISDHERPLIEKGIKRTRLIGNYLLQNNEKPDLIISSFAVRAYETAVLIAETLSYPTENIQVENNLYHSDVDILLDHIYSLSNSMNSVMMVGHNPTFTGFANYFLKNNIDWLPTSAVVCIAFKTDKWEDIHHAKKSTKFVISPKLLRQKK
ncbi:MAG: histidine phosphatase family protein [Bacteroidetes bacterium]|nr:MAG: histidine phosphatase family protein [Bacteroidota bacterium]